MRRTPVITPIPGDWLGAPHVYRIDWTDSGVTFSIDGQQLASSPVSIGAPMRPLARDVTRGGGALDLDWVRMHASRSASGSYTSRVLEAGALVTWDRAFWQAQVPAATRVEISVRTGSTSTPDRSWTPFVTVFHSGATLAALVQGSRYIQYRVELASTGSPRTPVLQAIGFSNNGPPPVVRPPG